MSLLTTLIGRADDLNKVRQLALNGTAVSLVGVSNLGKTALLRQLCEPAQQTNRASFVYVDCNGIAERTGRACFVAIWRALAEKLQVCCDDDTVASRAHELGAQIISASDPATFALDFERGLALALDYLPHPVVLCLDDFDEMYQTLEAQAFLNLRSLADRYTDSLVYITATEREMSHWTHTREQGEFLELLAHHVHMLNLMTPADIHTFCTRFAAQERVTFSDSDIAFIAENANGHPGLALAVCYALGNMTGAPIRNVHQDRVIHQVVRPSLSTDANVQTECAKIWDDLDDDERYALLHLDNSDDAAALNSLRAKSIVQEDDGHYRIFAPLFANFVRQQHLKRHPHQRGVDIDVEAGNVFVDGQPVEALTDLEYRLLTFLYGKMDRVCDKYSIVENVWGQQFIDQVDDARIEKLVSRVRAKIEPDSDKPRYLLSIRGRGYKLVR